MIPYSKFFLTLWFFVFVLFFSELYASATQIIIRTSAENAEIYIDNRYLGQSPLSVAGLPQKESYVLRVEKWGYETLQKSISINEESREMYIELEKIKYRKAYPNSVSFSYRGEPLLFGLEYTRYIDIPFGSVGISGGYGNWVLGNTFYSTSRLILGNHYRFSPYIGMGLSLYLYIVKTNTINTIVEDTTVGLVAFYFPVGILYSITEKIFISSEFSYWVVAGGYVKEEGGKPDTQMFETSKYTFWGGIKLGVHF